MNTEPTNSLVYRFMDWLVNLNPLDLIYIVVIGVSTWLIYWAVSGSHPPIFKGLTNIFGERPYGPFGHLRTGEAKPLYHRDKPAPILRSMEATTPGRIGMLFQLYPGQWCIAGGWAIDLYLGRQTREHGDIEVAVLRRDQKALFEHVLGWQPHYVDNLSGHELKPWVGAANLDLPIHELHTDPIVEDVAELEILLNESDGPDWVYRRDDRIRLPLAQAILKSPSGLPVLAPQIVLLFKSKNTRDRDEADFTAVIDALSADQRSWLKAAIELTAPEHPWLGRLG